MIPRIYTLVRNGNIDEALTIDFDEVDLSYIDENGDNVAMLVTQQPFIDENAETNNNNNLFNRLTEQSTIRNRRHLLGIRTINNNNDTMFTKLAKLLYKTIYQNYTSHQRMLAENNYADWILTLLEMLQNEERITQQDLTQLLSVQNNDGFTAFDYINNYVNTFTPRRYNGVTNELLQILQVQRPVVTPNANVITPVLTQEPTISEAKQEETTFNSQNEGKITNIQIINDPIINTNAEGFDAISLDNVNIINHITPTRKKNETKFQNGLFGVEGIISSF
jgi:hypothetical protein